MSGESTKIMGVDQNVLLLLAMLMLAGMAGMLIGMNIGYHMGVWI